MRVAPELSKIPFGKFGKGGTGGTRIIENKFYRILRVGIVIDAGLGVGVDVPRTIANQLIDLHRFAWELGGVVRR